MAGWPVVEGDYVVGDPDGCVAVCVLTSEQLKAPLATVPGVAIAGTLQTANLGVERLLQNVASNPRIRFLLLCGKESKLFQPGEALRSLWTGGVEPGGRIAGSAAFEPYLRNLAPALVERARRQVRLADAIQETEEPGLRRRIGALAAEDPGAFDEPAPDVMAPPAFKALRPGGDRRPLRYDPGGYFVITTEGPEIVVRHYATDHEPRHEMRGRNASSLLLGLLREELVSQLSHAGYLGIELEKAQLAARAGVEYHQDRPLDLRSGPGEFSAAVEVLAVAGESFEGRLLEPDPASPHDTFRRTDRPVSATWGTKIAMGGWDDVREGALLRLRGLPDGDGTVRATAVAVLTAVAKVS